MKMSDLELQKVRLDQNSILKKRVIQENSYVSFFNEMFHCGGMVAWMDRKPNKPNFGISKMEDKISRRWLVSNLSPINGTD